MKRRTAVNEITKKEMLSFLHDLEFALDWEWEPDSIELLHNIKSLIENMDKPKEDGGDKGKDRKTN